jgi:hypothetical protein
MNIPALEEGIAFQLRVFCQGSLGAEMPGDFQRLEPGWDQTQEGDQAIGFPVDVSGDGQPAQGLDLPGCILKLDIDRVEQQARLPADKLAGRVHHELFAEEFDIVRRVREQPIDLFLPLVRLFDAIEQA